MVDVRARSGVHCDVKHMEVGLLHLDVLSVDGVLFHEQVVENQRMRNQKRTVQNLGADRETVRSGSLPVGLGDLDTARLPQ